MRTLPALPLSAAGLHRQGAVTFVRALPEPAVPHPSPRNSKKKVPPFLSPHKRGEKRLRSYVALCATEGHESRVSDPRGRMTRICRAA